MQKIESFELDHTKVAAPYIRLAGETDLSGGAVIYKYDVRFTQPNTVEPLPTDAVHSLEHALATTLRTHTDGVIDISPMGCRTGYYVTVEKSILPEWNDFAKVFLKGLEDVLNLNAVPGATVIECGNAADHSLEGAKKAARDFLEKKEELKYVFQH